MQRLFYRNSKLILRYSVSIKLGGAMRINCTGLLLFVAASLWTTSTFSQNLNWAIGQDLNSNFMQSHNVTLPPVGYIDFCQRNPNECQAEVKRFDRQTLSAERWNELISVNRYANEAINPVSDQDLYGKLEYWTLPQSNGDCEDYVLLKRRMLLDRGWPLSTLLITVVLDENGEGHAVLTVRTREGDFILDNRRTEINTWNNIPYQFIKRQSYRNQLIWISLLPEPNNSSFPSADFGAENVNRY